MGLDVYLRDENGDNIQHNSEKYPTNYFKIGYFRSSYNTWGINRVLQRTIGKDLYYIFEPPDKKYEFKPKWLDCRMRCINVIEEFNEFVKKLGNVSVMFVSPRMFVREGDAIPQSEKEVIDIFLKIRDEREDKEFRAFSNREGTFYLDGIKCYGFISGKDIFQKDCTYIIYEPELKNDEKEHGALYKEYTKELEIVLETIDYILAQSPSEIKKYKLSWSA